MAFADLIVGKWNRNLFPWFTPGSRLSGCISFVSYIKPQHLEQVPFEALRCISFVSYIKPQLMRIVEIKKSVVYLSFPTSNHNQQVVRLVLGVLYIFRFLHQTTTVPRFLARIFSCISFVSYIKPQLHSVPVSIMMSCISFVSYIKPQPIVNYCLYINSLCCID